MVSGNVNTCDDGRYLQVGDCRLHYLKYGDGPQLALAFHGYGNNASLFRFLQHPDFTVLSIDLPFHGDSSCSPGSCLSKEQLKDMTMELIEEYHVDHIGLAGYSMGGRVCLTLMELLPQYIDNIVLLAPDGLRFNYFYFFLTRTGLGRFLFRDFTNRGDWYLNKITWIERFRLISKSKYRFAVQQIKTPAARIMLNNAWHASKQIIPDIKKVKKQIRQQDTQVHILMGAFDKIIPLKLAQHFKQGLPQAHIHVFQRGHALPEYAEVQGMAAAWLFNRTKNNRR